MITKTAIITEVKHTVEEDVEFWQGFDKNGNEVEYKSKRLHIEKSVDELGNITKMIINGEQAYSDEVDLMAQFNKKPKEL